MNALDQLMAELTPEQRAQVEGQKPRAKSATRQAAGTTDEAWTRANDLESADVGDWLGLSDGGPWKCPSCESQRGFDPVRGGFKCLHDRCQSRGKEGFLSNVDMVAELHGVTPAEAVNELAERFHFDPLPPLQPKPTNGSSHSDCLPPTDDDDPGEPPLGRFEDEPAPVAPRLIQLGVSEIFVDLPAVNWLCQALDLCPGAPALVAGYGYSGKTVSLQAFALAVATGTYAWGSFTVRQGRVLHVDFEQGRHLTCLRYQRIARAEGIGPADIGDRLSLVTLPTLYLDSAGAEIELTKACEGVDLLIVDSLRAASPTLDENSSSVRIVLDLLTRISDKTGVTPIVVHHARKPSLDKTGGARMAIRGSGALFDACSSVLVLEAEKNQAPVVHHEKARVSGKTAEDFCLSISDTQASGDPAGGLLVRAEPVPAGRNSDAPSLEANREKIRNFTVTGPR
jgi:hypothetical protein